MLNSFCTKIIKKSYLWVGINRCNAIADCASLPKFDLLFDRPFPGMYLFRSGSAFEKWA